MERKNLVLVEDDICARNGVVADARGVAVRNNNKRNNKKKLIEIRFHLLVSSEFIEFVKIKEIEN